MDNVEEPHEIVRFQETTENLALLKDTLAGQRVALTDPELKLFLYQVKRTGLDPLARQIYVMKDRTGRMSFITSIDGYRLVAERTGKYLGQTRTEWDFNGDGKVQSATVGVIKKTGDEKETTYATAWFSEYAKDTDKSWSMWSKMPNLMIAKVAEGLALRKAFPQELSGVYTDDEMQQVETNDTQEPEAPKRHVTKAVIKDVPFEDSGIDFGEPDNMPPSVQSQDTKPMSTETKAKLTGALKLKGFSEKQEVVDILNALGNSMFDAVRFDKLSNEQGGEMYARIVATKKEALVSMASMA